MLPPSPSINVGHNLDPSTPTDQHWLWGKGVSYFLSLSQILCTWLSEFWLKIYYFVKSVKSLLLSRGGSNCVWALPKTIKITFYDMNHLTPLWPPRSHGGWLSHWNIKFLNYCYFHVIEWSLLLLRGDSNWVWAHRNNTLWSEPPDPTQTPTVAWGVTITPNF